MEKLKKGECRFKLLLRKHCEHKYCAVSYIFIAFDIFVIALLKGHQCNEQISLKYIPAKKF